MHCRELEIEAGRSALEAELRQASSEVQQLRLEQRSLQAQAGGTAPGVPGAAGRGPGAAATGGAQRRAGLEPHGVPGVGGGRARLGGVACEARLAEQTSMIASLRQQLAAQAMALRSEALDV